MFFWKIWFLRASFYQNVYVWKILLGTREDTLEIENMYLPIPVLFLELNFMCVTLERNMLQSIKDLVLGKK